MAELKPCPFCGCKDVYVMRDKEVIIERYIAVCGGCYAQIYRPYQQEAIEDWNRRCTDEK
jgi:Lar family restriction alleviation protein